ncbi:hypothetical protein ABVK25_003461 [Lepraria finkii]|uniref:Uncharacterized protein n=1 Tax=Lepraria finkii TaxID=1340010 RepID=A0ABR4BKG4_9LECA
MGNPRVFYLIFQLSFCNGHQVKSLGLCDQCGARNTSSIYDTEHTTTTNTTTASHMIGSYNMKQLETVDHAAVVEAQQSKESSSVTKDTSWIDYLARPLDLTPRILDSRREWNK